MIRPKVLRTDRRAVDEAIILANEGKVTSKNAWDVKILDGFDSTVEAYMKEDEAIDAYTQFTKAASIVESGAKIWAHRVESTFLMTTRMQQRLMRSDWNEEKTTKVQDSQGNNKNDIHGRALLFRAAEDMDNKIKQASAPLVQSNSEISLTNKSPADTQEVDGSVPGQQVKSQAFSIDPLFKAMSARLGGIGGNGAEGLLMNTAHMGSQGNVILGFEQCTSESKKCFDSPLDLLGVNVHLRPFQLMNNKRGLNSLGGSKDGSPQPFQGEVSEILDVLDDVSVDHGSVDNEVQPVSDNNVDTENIGIPHEVEAPRRLSTTSVLNDISSFYDQDWIPIVPESTSVVKQDPLLEKVRKESALSMTDPKSDNSSTPKNRKRIRFEFDDVITSWIAEEDNKLYKEKLSRLNAPPLGFVNSYGKEYLAESNNEQNQREREEGERPHTTKIFDPDYAMSVSVSRGIVIPQPDDKMSVYLKSLGNIKSFLQPFCTSEPHWSWISRKKQFSNHNGQPDNTLASPGRIDSIDGPGVDDDDDLDINYDEHSIEASLRLPNLNSQVNVEDQSVLIDHNVEGLVNEPTSVMPVMKIQTATKPSFIDVSKLRSVMWKYIEKALQKAGKQCQSDLESPNNENQSVKFSEIVFSMIKRQEIQAISNDGSLSPAFFYFALLFLANERGLRLSQVPDVDDIIISTS